MYEIIKQVIMSKDYELSEMLMKIKKNCVRGDVTEEQETELLALARENALPENSYAGVQKQIDILFEKFNSLEGIVTVHTEDIAKMKGESPEPQPTPEEYPEYKQPTGAHDAYYKGDKVTFEGAKYICIAPDGTAVVWSPTEYPAYWQKVVEQVQAAQ